jgi:hypothetical protein
MPVLLVLTIEFLPPFAIAPMGSSLTILKAAVPNVLHNAQHAPIP